MDCKLIICELMNELKSVKASYLEEQLSWQGIEKTEISRSINILVERGVIYRGKGGNLELTDPVST